MNCPNCSSEMNDVTESWESFAEAEGAEYLATYVTIWHCSRCHTVVGAQDTGIEWVLDPQPQEAVAED